MAERATRIGLLAKDDKRAAEALALWRERARRSPALRAAEATLALRGGDMRRAAANSSADADPDDAGWRQALTVLGTGAKDPEAGREAAGAN